MMHYNDIVTALNDEIRKMFPDVNIPATDIKEGFDRPAFFVELPMRKTFALSEDIKERKISIRIYYFPTDWRRYQDEVLEVTEVIESLLLNKPLVVGNQLLNVTEVDSDVSDGILQCNFDIEFVEIFEETNDEGYMIETLDLKVEE